MTRPRTVRRQLEREHKKLDDGKLKLQSLEPGFRSDRPIVVDSASVIEPHVRGMHCPVCDVGYHVLEHVATPEGRTVTARCPQCGRKPKIWFVLRATTLS